MEVGSEYSYIYINHGISNNLALPKPEEKIDRHANHTKPIITAWSVHYRAFLIN